MHNVFHNLEFRAKCFHFTWKSLDLYLSEFNLDVIFNFYVLRGEIISLHGFFDLADYVLVVISFNPLCKWLV